MGSTNVEQEIETIAVNLYALQLEPKKIFRSSVFIQEAGRNGTVFEWSAPKSILQQSRNMQLIEAVRRQFALGPSEYCYDGAGVLFSLKEIHQSKVFTHQQLVELVPANKRDLFAQSNGDVKIQIFPDPHQPSFEQSSSECFEGANLKLTLNYLEIATSQLPVASGRYLPFRNGVFVGVHPNTGSTCGVADHPAVHKACKALDGPCKDRPVWACELDARQAKILTVQSLADLATSIGIHLQQQPFQDERFCRNFMTMIRDTRCTLRSENNRPPNQRTFKIIGLDWKAIDQGGYRRKYSNSRCLSWPAVVLQNGKEPVPLDYCRLTPFQRLHKTQLEPFSLMAGAMSPEERYRQITNHYDFMQMRDNPVLDHFGIRVLNSPTESIPWIGGLRSAATEFTFGDGMKPQLDDEKRNWKGAECAFSQPGYVSDLRFLVMPDRRTDVDYLCDVLGQLVTICKERGMAVGQWDVKVFPVEEEKNPYDWISDHVGVLSGRESPLVILLSEKNESTPRLLHEFLKWKEQEFDLPCQHILISTLCRNRQAGGPEPSLFDNISLKVNIKAGGLNYTSDPKDSASVGNDGSIWINDQKSFVIGLDVGHPEVKERDGNTPSVVGMAANCLENFYQFTGDLAYTKGMKEEIDDSILADFIDWSLRAFVRFRGAPTRIIVFRDGVSDAQEEEAIRESSVMEEAAERVLADEGFNSRFSMTVILVKKRHNTRFFCKRGDNVPQNCRVDTSVQEMVTQFGKHELFIQAHEAIQGTTRVPSFIILRNDESWSDTELIELIKTSCAMHQITNSPTASPTPAVVAHELADRGASLFRAYRFNCRGNMELSLNELSRQLGYRNTQRLSKIRFV